MADNVNCVLQAIGSYEGFLELGMSGPELCKIRDRLEGALKESRYLVKQARKKNGKAGEIEETLRENTQKMKYQNFQN